MNETTPITPPPAEAAGTPSADEKLWALFAHLSILVGGAITGGWAFSIGCFLGPLVIWIIKKDTMPFVNDLRERSATSITLDHRPRADDHDHVAGIGAILTIPFLSSARMLIVIIAAEGERGFATVTR
jgi:hypothetical protein